nr:hypothetical protein [Microbacterium azadirachtae]
MLDAFADLRDWERSGRGELDQSFFLSFQLVELLAQLCFGLAVGCEQVVDGVGDVGSHSVDDLGAEPFAVHGGSNFTFDLFDAEPRRGALLVLPCGADEVLVGAAIASVLAVDHAAGAPGVETLAAVDEPLEVVEVDDVAITFAIAVIEYFLHLEEGLLRDERFVAADVELALVAHHTGVIRVAEHESKTAAADLLGRPGRRRSGCESAFVEKILELADRVSSGGVLLEGPGYERRTFVVHIYGVDEASAELLADVEIAELGTSDGAALLDLVRHLDLDVLAVHADLDFVHDVGDGFHGVCHVALAEFFLGRDQAHALLEELALRDRGVGEVSEHA